MKPITIKLKNDILLDKRRILSLFFEDWVDANSNTEVHYQYSGKNSEFINIWCKKQEDALVIMLKGIPEEFRNYLEIVN